MRYDQVEYTDSNGIVRRTAPSGDPALVAAQRAVLERTCEQVSTVHTTTNGGSGAAATRQETRD